MLFPIRDDNPRRGLPMVTVAIIVVNIIVQFYQATLPPPLIVQFIRAAGIIPFEISHLKDLIIFAEHPRAIVPIPLTLFTAMFVHGGWLHLIGNMWYLWLFGDNLEDRMGHVRFLVFYLLVGLIASFAQIATNPASTIPTVGASGAIAGVLGGYALLFPHARVNCLVFFFFITVIQVPALIVLGLWFVLQVLEALRSTAGMTHVAWFAHAGGFVAGLVAVKLFARSYR